MAPIVAEQAGEHLVRVLADAKRGGAPRMHGPTVEMVGSRGDADHTARRMGQAPMYGWFTEGFDTADLQAAKALLEELRR